MRDVHVVFTGIVGLVPLDSGRMMAVLKNASTHPMHPHQAHIAAEARYVRGRPPNWKAKHPLLNVDVGVWNLDGVEISVLNAVTGGVSYNTRYIAKMNSVVGTDYPRAADMHSDFLTTTDGGLVAALMNFQTAFVSATWVHPKVQWTFLPVHGSQPGPTFLAQEVCALFSIDDDELVLQLTRLNGTDAHKLVFAAIEGTEGIELRIGNLPSSEIVPKPPAPGPDEIDYHFDLYYDMSWGTADEHPLPNSSGPLGPFLSPPQSAHPHRITMSQPAAMARLSEGLISVLSAAVAGSGKDDSGDSDVPEGGVGGHNCPPALWNPFRG